MSGLTSKEDLFKLCKEKGVYIDDILDFEDIPLDLKHGWYIFNMHPKDTLNGHWVCAKVPELYFDSFGIVPSTQIENILNRDYIYNKKDLQALNQTWCGQYCIACLWFLQNGSGSLNKRLTDYTDRFHDLNIKY